jgi:hypothetical protein
MALFDGYYISLSFHYVFNSISYYYISYPLKLLELRQASSKYSALYRFAAAARTNGATRPRT